MVVFDVWLMSYKRNFVIKVKVIFEMVDFNEGFGYDVFFGIFMVFSGGLYVFDWIILIWDKLYVYILFVVND